VPGAEGVDHDCAVGWLVIGPFEVTGVNDCADEVVATEVL
jgi:hypothetical protein